MQFLEILSPGSIVKIYQSRSTSIAMPLGIGEGQFDPLDKLIVVGTNAMPARHVEAAGTIRDIPDETLNCNLAWTGTTFEKGQQPIRDMLNAVDRTFAIRTKRSNGACRGIWRPFTGNGRLRPDVGGVPLSALVPHVKR